ncbi:aminotransferase class V-fold PLP-dependent enzyme [Sphingomonas donggukensis]|uniref:Cysteine desulfurase n=1 Tax=Sphingomonas donggukensis TaxID=2949093 RepID=A0ABY4U335_9SPHN|nr:aminotransferase class V-fold PLP-dependent enzyme [Sphingomonas donggukensis]URW76963.1 aminotransferase class V-fold PLP-dependent enzyme [Sphingomonas donggukensis]
MPTRLYLDHAATTPLHPTAAQAVTRGLATWANPSSPHAEGRQARAALESARNVIKGAYGWAGELILTSGASEAIGMALTRAQAASRIIAATEHDAVLRVAPDAIRLPVGSDGRVDPHVLRELLADAPAPALVAIQWGNSETGVIQPLRAIADVVTEAEGVLFVDAAQMPANWRGEDQPQDVADLIAISGHKRAGPAGIGGLLVRNLALLLPTGGQERGYRGGTENVPAALGYAAAVAIPEDLAAMAGMRARLDAAIAALGGEVVAGTAPRSPHIASYRLPGLSAAAQLIRFDMAGIAVSAGSACSSGTMRPSHVLGAMGWEGAAAGEVIRVSFGRDTTPADIERFITAWANIAREVRARAATTTETPA